MRLVRSDEDGSRERGDPFPRWPQFSSTEIEAVCRILESGNVNYWTGPEGRLFEHEFAQSVRRRYGVGVPSGTVALELAFLTLGLRPGDEVILPPRTYFGCASAIVLIGAIPVFADVDSISQNLTAQTIEPVLTSRTRAILAVHLAGWPCDMDPILDLAAAHDLVVIEDCAQAQGAEYRSRPVGSMSEVGIFSFCHDKIMTTAGEGGMLVMDEHEKWEMAWSFKETGKSFDAVFNQKHPAGFRWQRETFGTNWRLTEVQSAVGRSMLTRVPEWLQIRRRNADMLTDEFKRIPGLRITSPPETVKHAYYKYYAFIDPDRLKSSWDRDRIMVAVAEQGVPCGSGSCSEIYKEKAFINMGMGAPSRLQVAEELGKTSLMFDVHPGLSEAEMARTGEVVARVMSEAVC